MFTLNCRGRLLLVEQPLVMGIINITPDSFFEGSRTQTTDKLLRVAEKMMTDGASVIDIGGQSTRPGSQPVGADDELRRVIEPVRRLAERFPQAILSIDTWYAKVAGEAIAAGASIINDISGGTLDPGMFAAAGALKAPYILTHTRGTPETMQQLTKYKALVPELLGYFTEKIAMLRTSGVSDIIIDPGFGFAKTIPQNFVLLRELGQFGIFDMPLLAGLSRKGTIHKTLGIDVTEALNGSTVLHTIALLNGASILRVHDVKEAVEAVKLFGAYQSAR
ncbi:MAG: dihydropteroate synthase [Chitinophagaceae bacterium]|nr:MAG: dihydropteroate synthase [Chitinophagaceae bacterium]